MIRRLLYRLAGGAVTVWLIYTLTFLMVVSASGQRFRPGERNLPPEIENALRVRYRMDNHWQYYWEFLGAAVRFDFGPSFTYADWTCGEILADALPVSMVVGALAILVAVTVGVPAGVLGAVHRGGWCDAIGLGLTSLGVSVPTFVIGAALLIVFGLWLPIAPVGGWGSLGHLPLPVLTLAAPFTAYIARLTRASMLDVLASDFLRTALAMGASPRELVWRHALRVAILPVLSYLGPATAQAMTGSFVVERVFGVPGVGQHFVNAALNVDPGLLLATVLAYSTILVAINLVTDIAYGFVDPRIREAL